MTHWPWASNQILFQPLLLNFNVILSSSRSKGNIPTSDRSENNTIIQNSSISNFVESNQTFKPWKSGKIIKGYRLLSSIHNPGLSLNFTKYQLHFLNKKRNIKLQLKWNKSSNSEISFMTSCVKISLGISRRLCPSSLKWWH